MLDIRWIRDEPEAFERAMRRRGLDIPAATVLARDEARRTLLTELQSLQSQRNEASRSIGIAKKEGGDAAGLMAEVARLKERMSDLEEEGRRVEAEVTDVLSGLPNIPDDSVPDGTDDTDNVEERRVGEPARPEGAKDHDSLGEALGLMDFAAAAKLSGSRFVVLKGPLARLSRAIGQFFIDTHTTEFGYTEVAVPYLVRDEAAYGTAQLPKFAEDLFRTTNGYWLIPTAEMPLTNLVAGDILDAAALPLRVTALTPCFRSEAGAAGKDTRGMIRQHQFDKVELVSITAPDRSADELERMTGCAETVLQRLGLAYRVVSLCTGDLGFGARKTYDIEVWLPGQGAYREISSCSNCGDFQARRMNARCRVKGEKANRFVHTLNGSGVAVGRALIAVMESYQQPDGSIAVPEALRGYMGGTDVIAPPPAASAG
ncbi:MAG: serine--tRNA ligase [Alphaproteobacteria bacterium]|jgi:seryl-tRNA synthetase|nr:serine--tRNA ligase [Alphaproteobacteria bacterium]